MEKIDIVLWIMSGGFGLMLVMWNSMNKRMDDMDRGLTARLDKLDEKVTDIDRRLCRLEGAFSSKECCMIKDSSSFKKVE